MEIKKSGEPAAIKRLSWIGRLAARLAGAASGLGRMSEGREEPGLLAQMGLPDGPLGEALARRDWGLARKLTARGALAGKSSGAISPPLCPLRWACERGAERSEELVRLFLDAGANPDARIKETSFLERGLLTSALQAGNWGAARELMRRMKNPLRRDADGVSPAIAAARGLSYLAGKATEAERALEFERVCGELERLGEDFTSARAPLLGGPGGDTALHWAATSAGGVAALVKRGADVNARDRTGKTPLMSACEGAATGAIGAGGGVRALLRAGADARLTDHAGRDALGLMADDGGGGLWRPKSKELSEAEGSEICEALLAAGLGPLGRAEKGLRPWSELGGAERIPGMRRALARWEAMELGKSAKGARAQGARARL